MLIYLVRRWSKFGLDDIDSAHVKFRDAKARADILNKPSEDYYLTEVEPCELSGLDNPVVN